MVIHSSCLLWSTGFCPSCPQTSFAICYCCYCLLLSIGDRVFYTRLVYWASGTKGFVYRRIT